MSKTHTATAAMAGFLTLLTPALAWQNQGSTTGSQSAGAPLNEGQGSTGQGAGQDTNRGTLPKQKDSSAQKHGSMNNQDHKFAMAAAEGGLMEVELGRLASQKAANADVKAFAQRMVTDHGKANTQLMQVASQKGMTLPTALAANKRQEMDKLTKASGAEFDRLYMSHMVKHHQKDVSDFEKQSQKGEDAALRSFAQQNLPTLREHLRLAQDLASRVGAQTSSHGNH